MDDIFKYYFELVEYEIENGKEISKIIQGRSFHFDEVFSIGIELAEMRKEDPRFEGWTIYEPEGFSFLFIAGKYEKEEGLTKQHIIRIEQVEYQKPEGEVKNEE